MEAPIRRLASEVRQTLEITLADVDLAAQKTRFIEQVTREAEPSYARWLAAAGAAAAVFALCVSLLHRPELGFSVTGAVGKEGQWIAASVERSLPIAFTDGTELVLQPEARARVVALTKDGAHIVLERGRIVADVVHRADARWRLDAGPYVVDVIGTRFEVSWDPVVEHFELILQEGRVRVNGPKLASGRDLAAGDRVALDVGLKPTDASSNPNSALPTASARSQDAVAGPSRGSAAKPLPARPAWSVLAKQGLHGEAWRRVEDEGFDSVLTRATAAELTLLADVARFTGHPTDAMAALVKLRQRFPAQALHEQAAFLLGRIAFDQSGSPKQAAEWFSTYLIESPKGAFAQEAAGRLIESQQRVGASDGARTAARRYLMTYPNGPHAPLARRVLAPLGGGGGPVRP
jgi:hypothetical protein